MISKPTPTPTTKGKPVAAFDKITPEDIQKLPLLIFEGPIQVIEEKKDLQQLLERLSNEPLVGIDTEKRPSFKKGQYYPVSLLQLATEKEAFIIRIKKTGFPQELKQFFECPRPLKVGLALHDDIKDLQRFLPFHPEGLVQLDALAKLQGMPQTGLRSLAAHFLKGRISKACQKSNWSNPVLTPQQIQYAATDAWVCVLLYPFLLKPEV